MAFNSKNNKNKGKRKREENKLSILNIINIALSTLIFLLISFLILFSENERRNNENLQGIKKGNIEEEEVISTSEEEDNEALDHDETDDSDQVDEINFKEENVVKSRSNEDVLQQKLWEVSSNFEKFREETNKKKFLEEFRSRVLKSFSFVLNREGNIFNSFFLILGSEKFREITKRFEGEIIPSYELSFREKLERKEEEFSSFYFEITEVKEEAWKITEKDGISEIKRARETLKRFLFTVVNELDQSLSNFEFFNKIKGYDLTVEEKENVDLVKRIKENLVNLGQKKVEKENVN